MYAWVVSEGLHGAETFATCTARKLKCACAGAAQVLDKFVGIAFTVEYKYDGERAQVHVMEDARVAIYRRALRGGG